MKKNNEEFSVAELQKVMGEITELLEKSEGMYKDDEEDGMPEEGAPAGPEGGIPPEGQPAPGPEASPEGMPPQEGAAPEDGMAPEGDAGHEGQESDSEESMEELIHSMSEEQLQMMLQAIQAALASKGQEGGMPSEGQPAPAPGPEGLGKSDDKDEDDLKKSKEDAHKPAVGKDKMAKDVTPKGQKPDNDLKKSIDSLVGVVGQLAKDVAELKAPKAPAAKVVSKMPKTTTQIQVLEKSVKVAERLSKSETIEFLHNQIRQGNRLITKRDISDVSYANSNEAMAKVQDGMVQRGIVKEFPKK